MRQGILLSAEVDFMIHGVFSYEIFGQTVWITTTHICLLIIVFFFVGALAGFRNIYILARKVYEDDARKENPYVSRINRDK